ncbi:SRPBCC family protein [Rhodococcus globerulus]|uniref:SRPBCC family protein n=1 Tax=Rhodococcus globerulus TaxID=33008 RepID=UPI0005255772|nr:SRPBCC family protein [Rhodococcus globerulus]PVX59536.1 carbon monoxide dehydrogenase subunit G [Rhodococcus globerulus]
MIFENNFNVPTEIDEAWALLLDVERVAPCMPGATLDTVEGDEFTGRIRVKVGAIQMTYKMKGRFVERDEDKRRVVIEGSGKENRGAGTVSATITLTLTPNGATTDAHVATDLAITGRPAQFGRGVMEDIGTKIIGQFAKNLAAELDNTRTEPTAAEATATTTTSAAPTTATKLVENEPLDLVGVLAPSKGRIIAVAAAAGLLAVFAAIWLRRESKRS